MSAEEIKLEVIRNQFTGNENSVDLIAGVLDILPHGYGSKVVHVSGQLDKFEAFVDVNLRSVSEVASFVNHYEEKIAKL